MKHNSSNKHRRLRIFSLLISLLLILGAILFVTKLVRDKTQSSVSHTPTATPTPTLTPSGAVQPLFADTFLDNSKGWSVVHVSGYTRTLQNGVLTLSDTNHTVLVESIPTNTVFSDFALTMTFTLIQADRNDSVGLYIRGDSNLDHDYRVDIFGDNTYSISKETLNTNNDLDQTFLAQPTHTQLLNTLGQKNTLAITMQGTTMVMQINGKTLYSLTDTQYKRGQIALFVQNGPTSNGVTVNIHNLTIYPIANQALK